MPSTAIVKNIVEPVPTAPIAAGPSGPTKIVSTMPIVIQPISEMTTGPASRSICPSSRRIEDAFTLRP